MAKERREGVEIKRNLLIPAAEMGGEKCFIFLHFRRLIGTIGWAGEVGGVAAGVDCFWIKDEEDQVWRWEGSDGLVERAQICSRLWEEEDESFCKWRSMRYTIQEYTRKERSTFLPFLLPLLIYSMHLLTIFILPFLLHLLYSLSLTIFIVSWLVEGIAFLPVAKY